MCLFHLLPTLVSRSLMRAANSGSRAYNTYCSLNFAKERAGVPHTGSPPRIVLPPSTPDCPPITAPSLTSQRSPNPACPPITTFFPTTHDPENPARPAITVCVPVWQLCPT